MKTRIVEYNDYNNSVYNVQFKWMGLIWTKVGIFEVEKIKHPKKSLYRLIPYSEKFVTTDHEEALNVEEWIKCFPGNLVAKDDEGQLVYICIDSDDNKGIVYRGFNDIKKAKQHFHIL